MSEGSHDRLQYLKLYEDAELNTTNKSEQLLIERYLDKELIGEGGVKRVYKTYDQVVDRFVAFAELKLSNTEVKREAFLREAQLTAQLDHPNIISIYDISDETHESPWFTIELKTGSTLEKNTNTSSAKLQIFLEQFLKVCDAINYAHSRGIVHLDLKPDNIQIGNHGEVLVCDWGLGQMLNIEDKQDLMEAEAEHLELFKDVTITGKINGTPGYMAPEQIHQRTPKSPQTDIYSLGAMLYTGLCSTPPLTGNIEEMLEKTEKGNITFPKVRFPELQIPESLDAVVRKAMSTDPNDRYQKVSELSRDIRQYLTGFTTHAEKSNLLKEMKFFYKRHQMVCSMTLVALFSIVTIVSIYQNNLSKTLDQLNTANQSIQEERDRAEQALSLAVKNKTWLNDLVLDNQVQLTKSVYDYCAVEIYQNPLKAMDLAVHELKLLKDANPDNKFNTTQLGYVYAIMQKFPESLKAYTEHPPGMKDTLEPIRKMAETYKNERPLRPEVLISFMSDMRNNHNPMFSLRLLYYDAELRKNWNEHATIAHHVLKLWNPDWVDDQFIYDQASKQLTLKGRGLSLLTHHHTANSTTRNWDIFVNLVGSLPIDRLILSGTDYYDFASLKELPVHYIDISYTAIKKLYSIQDFKYLKTLVVHEGQLDAKQLRKFPKHINLLIK